MPRAKPEPKVPFVAVVDGPEITGDPVNSRCIALFDALRKRYVGPEKAAYVVSMVHQNSGVSGGHALPPRIA